MFISRLTSKCRRSAIVSGLAVLAPALILVLAAATSAQAKIRCNGPFQIIKGHGQLATPYCGDNYLGKVAREYGMRVSDRAIRNNPNRKEEVCRLVGHDTRVQDICAGLRPEDSGRGGVF